MGTYLPAVSSVPEGFRTLLHDRIDFIHTHNECALDDLLLIPGKMIQGYNSPSDRYTIVLMLSKTCHP